MDKRELPVIWHEREHREGQVGELLCGHWFMVSLCFDSKITLNYKK